MLLYLNMQMQGTYQTDRPIKGQVTNWYLFTYGDTAISWRSTKQTLTTKSSNHAELIALCEAERECVWLRSMINKIQKECGMNAIIKDPTIIYEYNTACIARPDQIWLGSLARPGLKIHGFLATTFQLDFGYGHNKKIGHFFWDRFGISFWPDGP